MNGSLYRRADQKIEDTIDTWSSFLSLPYKVYFALLNGGISIFCCSEGTTEGNIYVVNFISSFDFSHKGLAYSISKKKKKQL